MADPPATAAPVAAPSPKNGTRQGCIYAVAVVMTLCVALLVTGSIPDETALALSVVAAVVPALVYSWIVLRLDRYEAEPRRVIVGTFGWGAVGAIFFSVIAELIFAGFLVTTIGPEAGSILTVAVGAPLIEEFFKGVGILFLVRRFREEFDNVLDGLVYGALIGLGFAMTENILYFGAAYAEGGLRDFGELFVARSVIDGFGHAVYTGTFGAAVGWAREQPDRGRGLVAVPVIGYVLAVVQHMLWNGGSIVILGLEGEDATIWSVVLLLAPLFLLPALVVLYLIARGASQRELEILREELAGEVDHGVLTPAEYEQLTSDAQRKAVLREAKERGGKPLARKVRRYYQVAAELAFRKYHLRRGESPKPGQHAPDELYRAELAVLRDELTAAGLTPSLLPNAA
jgi:RsiW-degrading membrane proteinase PrsW (M82 family)